MDIQTKNPWTTLSTEEKYDNPWITILHNDVLNPSGGKGIYGLVHFKNWAIAILPLDENYNTWLVGQYRYTINQYSWEIPEGGGKIGDDPLLAARRELLEETGIVAENWSLIGEVYTSNSVTDEKGYIYVAKNLSFGTAQPEETEKLEVRKLPFSEVVEMVMRGEITDGFAVAAILKTKLLIDRGEI